MNIEKTATIDELSHKDIGKAISFTAEIASIKAEFRGVLGGIDRLRITLKMAEFKRSSESNWSKTHEANPEIVVEPTTAITVFEKDSLA